MFKKGNPKPKGSGRAKGVKNKSKIIKISDFVLNDNIDLPREIYQTIQSIQDPVAKTKALMDYYKFIDAPVKEKEIESEDNPDTSESLSTDNVLKITNE